MIGRSPNIGTLFTSALVWRDTRPLITKLSPSPSSMVVSARRVRSAGITVTLSALVTSGMPLL